MICEADLRTYAKGFHGRFGARAVAYARDYAEQLQAQGDGEGHDVWQKVAELIQKAQADNKA
jgi:hypothetical protein